VKGPAIEEHGVIGDLHTVALVGMDGTIDFMCVPRFDSPTVFAALLDRERGGCFELAPVLEGARHTQMYLPDTNVLLTRFLSPGGVAEVTDFMPVNSARQHHRIVRRIKAVRGEMRVRARCAPRFDYARATHRAEACEGGVLFTPDLEGCPAMRLRATVPVRAEEGDGVAEFTLHAGETAHFVLEEAVAGAEPTSMEREALVHAFKETVNYWRRWIGRSTYTGLWRDHVHRSALVLKMLVSEEFGSLVAAPTFSLPEAMGGERNWDYRYTWIRDSTFTLYALIRLGLTDETGQFMRWIEARCGESEWGADGPLQPLYGIDGRHAIEEVELTHLRGYGGSRPVRIGNAAYRQLQLDQYGALMDSAYLYDKHGEPVSYDFWCNLSRLTDWVADHWHRPDEGIWEVRGGRQHFVHSRLLCWVTLDRAVRLAQKRSLPAPLARWRRTRDRIYRDIHENFWHPGVNAFVQHRDTDEVDAATLLMPMMRFIAPRDPRWLLTLRRIHDTLLDDSLVHRYRTEHAAPDGLEGPEGTFSMCSFWYVECLSRAGDLQQARFLFEKMLGYANHLGLYAEELGPSGEHLGNFPQAFTHLALISAAYDLDRRLSAAGWTA
jgi:GH15 family glucan-1,4-alpha-glucosidase